MNFLTNFFKRYSVTTHTLTVSFATLFTLYDSVPQFHALVVNAYKAMPSWAEQLLVAAFAVYAWYRKGQPKNALTVQPGGTGTPPVSSTTEILP